MAVDRSGPPATGTPKGFAFPEIVRRELVPGLELLVAPLARAPLVTVELFFPGGAVHDPEGRTGLASFTASLFDDGTAGRSAPEIAALSDRLGASLGTGCEWDSASVSMSGLAEHLPVILDLLAELAMESVFPGSEVERVRARRIAEIVRRESKPGATAVIALLEALYGDGPYGHPTIGRRPDVEAITPDEIREFAEDCDLRGGGALVVAGAVDPGEVVRLGEELFAGWPDESSPDPPPVEPRSREAADVVVVDRPGASQSEVRIGHPGPERTHPDRPAIVVMNALLGGKFTSRINLNLRERHGYTYGASSRISSRKGPGPTTYSAAVATESAGAAVREILGEMRRLRAELPTEEEVEETVDYVRGVFPYTLQTTDDVAHRLGRLAVFGLPSDYYERNLEAVAEVEPADVRRVAEEHLDPETPVVVVVGPAAELEPQLGALGELRVVPFRPTAPPGAGDLAG